MSTEAQALTGEPGQEVLVFSDDPAFQQRWAQVLGAVGLATELSRPRALPAQVQRGRTLVVDAGSAGYDEEELLVHLGLARALGATPVVAVPFDADVSSIDDLLDDLCGGLVARRPEDVGRVVSTLARRVDKARGTRFEYLTVSPRGGELLAILADGTATLLPRPLDEDDDGSDVVDITLEDEETRATLELETGGKVALHAATVAARSLLHGGAERSHGNGALDGAKLGKRLRELRLAAGLTQAELARRTGIHRPNIARVEAGRHTPSLDTIARLATAIGVTTTRVLDEG